MTYTSGGKIQFSQGTSGTCTIFRRVLNSFKRKKKKKNCCCSILLTKSDQGIAAGHRVHSAASAAFLLPLSFALIFSALEISFLNSINKHTTPEPANLS